MASNDDLIRDYAPFVVKVVAQTRKQLGLTEEVEDLTGYAYEGLLEARKRYEPEHGTPFQSFAYFRVRGAVIDGVRSMGKLQWRAHARLVGAQAGDVVAERQFAGGGYQARDPERALRSIDEVLGGMATAYYAALASEREPEDDSPEGALLAQERAALLGKALAQLPERQRRLVEEHHLRGRPLDDVIAELGYARSWGRQLYSKTLADLRQALSDA